MLIARPILTKVIPRSRLGDTFYSYLQFIRAHGRFPGNRLSFNDYLFRVKTSPQIDLALAGFVSDKELVKLFVKAVVGDHYNVPTIAVLRSEQDVLKFSFPKSCVVKPTHASGKVIFVQVEQCIDLREVLSWFRLDLYREYRERNYRHLQKKVIVEETIFNSTRNNDYKFHCFNGRVKFVHVDVDRHSNHRRAFFDRDFVQKPFSIGYPIYDQPVARPGNFGEMVEVAEAISAYFPFIRVDMYTDGTKIFVGEITNVHGNASEPFFPRQAEAEFGPLFFPSK